MSEDNFEGCRHLWCSILERIFTDACKPLDQLKGSARAECQRARDWLFAVNDDFERVCHYAGIEPDVVRSYAARLESSGWCRSTAKNDPLRRAA